MSEENYDILVKVVLIGDSGVGKTNILSRYVRDEFNIETKATVGVEFGCKILKVGEKVIKVQIWDTAGQERYKSITNAYYKGAKGAFVVYDITKKESFNNVDKWIEELKQNGESEVCIILIGNKCDLEEKREVSLDEGISKSKDYNIAFLETSAMHAVNIDKAFTEMTDEIYKSFSTKSGIEANGNRPSDIHTGIRLSAEEPQEEDVNGKKRKKKKKCCHGK